MPENTKNEQTVAQTMKCQKLWAIGKTMNLLS